jgi:hypothetical protein
VDSAFALAALVGLVGTLTTGIILVRAARRLSRAATRAPLDLSAAPGPGESYRLKRRPAHPERRHPAPAAEEELTDDDAEDWAPDGWAGQGWAGQGWAGQGWAAEEERDEQFGAPPGAPADESPDSKPAVAQPKAPDPVVAQPKVAQPVVAESVIAESVIAEDLLSALTPEQRAIVIAFRRELDAAGRQADRKALYANLLFFAAGILASILVTLLVHPL